MQDHSEPGQEGTQHEDSLRQKVLDLHQRWGKCAHLLREEEDMARERQSRCNTQNFTREETHRKLPWEPDSISHAAFDPDPILDCNVKANVGRDFFFHGPIPEADRWIRQSHPKVTLARDCDLPGTSPQKERKREREREGVCVRERESVCVCQCVCVREREIECECQCQFQREDSPSLGYYISINFNKFQ